MLANGPYQMASMMARSTVSVRPYRYTLVRVQVAAVARSFSLPSLAPFSRGRPRLPVRGGAQADRDALAGSRVVQVVSATSRALPW